MMLCHCFTKPLPCLAPAADCTQIPAAGLVQPAGRGRQHRTAQQGQRQRGVGQAGSRSDGPAPRESAAQRQVDTQGSKPQHVHVLPTHLLRHPGGAAADGTAVASSRGVTGWPAGQAHQRTHRKAGEQGRLGERAGDGSNCSVRRRDDFSSLASRATSVLIKRNHQGASGCLLA